MADHARRGVVRCLRFSDERSRTYGWHHHGDPHAYGSGNHDGHCPWRAQMSGPGFERTRDLTAAINDAIEDLSVDSRTTP